MRKIYLTVLALLGFLISLPAASLHILYDEACMDRLEYAYENDNKADPYIVYQVNTSPGEKIILEVGAESSTTQDFMPPQVIRCSNAVFDKKLVNAINSKIDRVYMVVKKGNNRYVISPINFAAHYIYADDMVLYDSPKYRFQFDIRNGVIGENIAYNNPKAEVAFEGKLENECSGAYLFQQYSEYAGNPHTNIILVPELGIVEERSGINREDALKNTLRLQKVNGTRLQRYMRRLCSEDGQRYQDAVSGDDFINSRPQDDSEFYTVGDEPTQPFAPAGPDVYNTSGPRIPANDVQTTKGPATVSSPEMHIVEKGQTLYGIAKKHNTTVGALKSTNGLGSNTIYPGQRLQLPGAAPAVQEYGTSGGRIGSSPGVQMDRPAPSIHTVQAGENLNAIAARYGTTATKLKAINQKTSNTIYPGEKLQLPAPEVMTAKSAYPQQERIPNQYNTYQQRPRAASTTQQPLHIVRPGETIASIAMKYGYTENRFRQFNGLAPNAVAIVGSQLKASHCDCPEDGRTVQMPTSDYYPDYPAYPTDRLDDYNSNTVQPKSGEGFQKDRFDPGSSNTPVFTELPPEAPAQPAYTPGRNDNPQWGTKSPYDDQPVMYDSPVQPPVRTSNSRRTPYIVKDGDTLFSIARRYNTTVERLREINNLARGEVLIPYQKIYLN